MPILELEGYIYTLIIAYHGFKKEDVDIGSPIVGTKLNYDRARIARMLVGEGEIITIDEARKFFFNLEPVSAITKSKKK